MEVIGGIVAEQVVLKGVEYVLKLAALQRSLIINKLVSAYKFRVSIEYRLAI